MSPDLWDYVGERLPENALERVEKHLIACAVCQTEVEGMRRAQNLLNDCRRHVPAPRSDWHDLQNRMRAEGMISPLSGRILTQEIGGQVEATRASRRLLPALDWNRLSLVGSVAATLFLSVSIYRLTTPSPTQEVMYREAAVPNFMTRQNTQILREVNTKSSAPIVFGDPFPPFMIQINASTPTQLALRRNTASVPAAVVQNRRDEKQKTVAETDSPIVWAKPQRPYSPAPPRKYVARTLPSQANKSADDTVSVSPALNMSRNVQDAKTRYIMRHLTPSSFTEEGIY